MIYGFVIEAGKEKECVIENVYDGLRKWNVFMETAASEVQLTVNEAPVEGVSQRVQEKWLFAAQVGLPKGWHVVGFQADLPVQRVLIADIDIDTSDVKNIERAWENRLGQVTFQQDRVNYTQQDLRVLRRHGFVMHQIKDTQFMAAPSGLPLGGIGAGKVEITSTGQLTAFTGNNNQDAPVYRMPGSYFAVGVAGERFETARVLQTEVVDQELLPAAGVEADVAFPFGRYRYNVNPLPIQIEMNAFSSHIPGDKQASSLPVAHFDFIIRNVDLRVNKVALCFSWENLINVGGNMKFPSNASRILPLCYHTWNASYVWSDRRSNRAEAAGNTVRFYAQEDKGNPASFGEHIIWCSDPDALAFPDRSLEEDEFKFCSALAVCFRNGFTPTPEGEFRAGALASVKELQPGEEAHISFALCWYMPHMPTTRGDSGVYYATLYKNANELLNKALEEKSRLYAASAKVSEALKGSDLPEWFARRLLDDRFVADTCTWFAADGSFSVNEAPTGMSGCLGTLDQRAASQGYWATFFPELDDVELELFRRCQAEDGLCSHHVGFSEIALEPTVSTLWPDLAAAYVYQVYHHWQRTGDDAFIRRHYPHVKKAVAWAESFDDTDCGVPYIKKGRGTTYDNQHWEGINSFIASVHMAMLFLAADMAKRMNDPVYEEYARRAERARDTRLRLLWNEEERYFRNAFVNKTGETDESCFIASLAGDWYLMSSGIDSGIDQGLLRDAARAILKHCYGSTGMTDQGGRKNTPAFMQYPAAYYCAPAALVGAEEAAWAAMKLNDDVLLTAPSNHFIQGLTYLYTGGGRGLPYYMTAPSTWNFLDALAGLVCDKRDKRLHINPKMKGKVPVFTQDAWFYVEAQDDTLSFTPIQSFAAMPVAKLVADGVCYELSEEFDPGKQSYTIQRKACARG